MLDMALSVLEVPLPPEVPRIVEERQWLSRLGVEAERRTRMIGDQYDGLVVEWLARLRALQDGWRTLPPTPLSDAEAKDLADLIDEVELLADHRTRWRAAFAKHGRGTTKRFLGIDPSVAVIYRAFHDRLVATDDRVIAAMLDHALFLRAIRADRDPDARGGPEFTDPADLQLYLKAALAS